MSIEVCGPGGEARGIGRVQFPDGGGHSAFDYTGHLECLIRRWCQRYRQLGHIEMDRVVLSVAKCRSKSSRGLQASISSLRFPNGRCEENGSGRVYRCPRVKKGGREALYLIKFYLPRFHDLSVEDKVGTILHELYHIHPKFNGELRCFAGRNWAHGASHKKYEMMFKCLKRDILKRRDPFTDVFLNCKFRALLKRFGDVYADRLIFTRPVEKPACPA